MVYKDVIRQYVYIHMQLYLTKYNRSTIEGEELNAEWICHQTVCKQIFTFEKKLEYVEVSLLLL